MITSSISLYQVPACCCSSALNVEGGVLGIVSFANYLLSAAHSPWANSLPRCFLEHLSGQCRTAGGPVVTVQSAEHVRNLHPSVHEGFFSSLFFEVFSEEQKINLWDFLYPYKVCVKSRRLPFHSPRKMCACVCYVWGVCDNKPDCPVLWFQWKEKNVHASESFARTCKLK